MVHERALPCREAANTQTYRWLDRLPRNARARFFRELALAPSAMSRVAVIDHWMSLVEKVCAESDTGEQLRELLIL
jgi:hypothetical protein